MQTHDHFLSRIYMMFFIAWRNLWRNKARSILTISALSGGLLILIIYAALLEGMVKQMTEFSTNISSGHLQIHRQLFREDQDLYSTIPWESIQSLEKENQALSFSPRLYAAGLASSGDISIGAMIKAIDPAKERQVTTMLDHIRSGDTKLGKLPREDSDFDRYYIVVGAQLASNMKVKIGDELVLITQAADGSIGNGIFVISGVLKPIEPNFDRTGILMSIDAYKELMYLDSGAHEIAISIPENADLISIKQQLLQTINTLSSQYSITNSEDFLELRTWRELMPAVSDMVEVSRAAIYILGLIMLGLASMGMLNTVMMSIYERKHEFGILLSIGMGNYWLLLMIVFESFIITLISVVVGTLAGIAGAVYMQNHGIDMSSYMPDGFDYAGIIFEPIWKGHINISDIFVCIILTIIISLTASMIPSLRITKMKPVEVLH